MTTGFAPLDGLDQVYVARSGKLSCTALRLQDASLCLYSPTAGLEKVLRAQVDELGPVSALLAPNHYHNKGLAAHVAAFPDASLYATAAAAPRLSRITGLAFDPLERLAKTLGAGQTLHEPEGLKTGEVWVQIRSAGACGLVVTDAFSAAHCAPGHFASDVSLLGTFPRYGVQDAKAYTSWSRIFLSDVAPTILLPCHGSPVRSADLPAQLVGTLDALASSAG